MQSAILDEHQAAPSEQTGAKETYNPSEEDLCVIKHVMQKFQEAREARKRYDYRWLDYYRMFRGKQWPAERPSWKHAEVFNLIWQLIQSNVPQQTDAKPTAKFYPQDPSDQAFTVMLNEAFEADWDRFNWQYVLAEMLYDSNIYGTGGSTVDYDPEALLGLGATVFKTTDPFYCFPDPDSKSVNDPDGDYFIYAQPIRTAKAKRKFPKFAQFIKSDCKDLLSEERTELGKNLKFAEGDMTDVFGMNSQDQSARQEGTFSLEIDCWMKDGTLYDENDPDKPGETRQRMKYPGGRRVTLVSGVKVRDEPNPFDDQKFPFQKHSNYILPREYYGVSEIEPVEGPQKIFNKLVSFCLDVLVMMGNPIWVIDDDAEIDTDNLFNRPGDIVEKARGSEARREPGADLQPWVLNMIDRMKELFDNIGGTTDVSRGVNPTGVTAASAIEALQATAQTRIRQKSRNLDAFIQEFGQAWVSRTMQFMTAPRIFRLTNNQGASKYFRMSIVPDEKRPGKKMASVVHYNEDDVGNVQAGNIEIYQINGEFDVKVDTGSSLPFAKADEKEELKFLLTNGVIDPEEYFKKTNYAGYQDVLQRMKEAASQQAQKQGA